MNSFRQTAVGIFVLLGLVCVAYLTIKLGKMEVFDSKGFELVANFNSVPVCAWAPTWRWPVCPWAVWPPSSWMTTFPGVRPAWS